MKSFPLRIRSSPLKRFTSRTFSGRPVVWWIALVCAIFGILTGFHIVIVPVLTGYSYWIVLVGLIALLVATR
jgi:hypothetical protein